ncbi:hypothetical protein N0V83_002102 [Neocucurbitaria cava]|uniref:Cytochrome b561 domain-containing protein n=1 Tax=Neocucurbitaria cava TaxID=798079 RepID=A0A9W9CQI3_9PLEO|nr:hypothetical protein N0V83_002102 [Neocucurbitaria cava]
MASATGIPSNAAAARGQSEEEPLLGRRGDASQAEGEPLYHNLWIGMFIQAVNIEEGFVNEGQAGFLLAIQAALVLQPTHTPEQKRAGTLAHLLFHVFGTTALTAGLIIIEMNKAGPGHEHFESPHARLGLIFYILVYLQAIVGFTQYYVPGLYGGVENAKSIYKYHRLFGYIIATLGLATICAASWTTYSLYVAHIQHWAVIVASVLVLLGVLPRIRLSKFGLKREEGTVRLQ